MRLRIWALGKTTMASEFTLRGYHAYLSGESIDYTPSAIDGAIGYAMMKAEYRHGWTVARTIAGIKANAADDARMSAEAYRHARTAGRVGNMSMYRFWMLRGKQANAHYQAARDEVSRLAALLA